MTDTNSGNLPPLLVRTDRPTAMYGLGEPVTFAIERRSASGEPVPGGLPEFLSYVVTADGATEIERGAVRAADLPQSVVVRPTKPGFVRLDLEFGGAAASETAPQAAAAAIAPERIEPSLPPPDDFDEFWETELKPQQSAPLTAEVVPHSECAEGRISKVRVAMPSGDDIHGWLLLPHGNGPFPGVVRYHGAGVYGVPPDQGLEWTARGTMVFSINPHAIPNDESPEFYSALQTGALADYRTHGRDDRRSMYFREMFLRAARAVDFLAGRPEWNGVDLIAEGHSQGGGQALAATALNGNVSAMVVSCPTHCDHTGPLVGRAAGWPQIVEVTDGVPNRLQVRAVRYYDGVNFAGRITVPSFVSLAFLDGLCSPTGIYAAYNALRGPKHVRHDVAIGHVYTEACRAATYRWVGEQTGR